MGKVPAWGWRFFAAGILVALAACAGAGSGRANSVSATTGYVSAGTSSLGDAASITDSAYVMPKSTHAMHTLAIESKFYVPILEYHDITFIPGNEWGMSANQFASEMKFLVDSKFHVISMDQLYAAMYHGVPLPSRPVLITFDDGYDSTYTNAFPILREYGFHATVFMISGYINHKGYASAVQLLEMANSGLIDVESHSVDHKNLMYLSDAQTRYELNVSRDQLSQLLHRPVRYFCYPYGGYRWQTLRDVRQAGYLLATSTHHGYASQADDAFRLKRLAVYSGIGLQAFAQLLAPSFSH